MIKHHMKLKSPKQDIVQTYASPKSTFYIARRLVQSNSDKSIKLLNQIKTVMKNNHNQQTYSELRVQMTTDYRSQSTIPTHTRGQLSQNIDQQSYQINTERQQSSSILTQDFLIHHQPKTNRVTSLYQVSVQNCQLLNNEQKKKIQELSPFIQRSTSRINSIMNDQMKLNNIEDEMIDNTPIDFKKDCNNRKSIFMNTNYQTYQKMSKVKIKNKQQTNQKQQIFVQKVLKNIKDSQNEKSESKQILRKYSQIWKENFSQKQFQDQQQYKKSSQQFKLYFNQYIEKLLNKHIIYQFLQQNLEIIKVYIEQIQQNYESLHDLTKMYIENHKLKCVQTQIQDQKFRYKKDIKSFGMIDILNEFQEDEINDNIEYEQDEVQVKQIMYFTIQIFKHSTSYHIEHIISILDNETKNILLSVNYTDLDELIYQNNMEESIPQIEQEDAVLKRTICKLFYQHYPDILIGNYFNLDQLIDIEDDNYFEQQQQMNSLKLDKKAMLLSLRRKTREAKMQGRRSNLFDIKDAQQFKNIIALSSQKTNNLDVQVLTRRMSKSMHNLNSDQILEYNDRSLQESDRIKDFNIKPVKYKQQLRLQNLILFDHIIKRENCSTQLVQMMIEHNLFDELKEYLRQHPNFSLNQRNIEGKPFIMLAAQSGNVELVQYMINLNIQINMKDLDGNTALHYAISLGYYKIADILLQNGANPYIRNRCNQNPWNQNQQLQRNYS